MFDKLTKLFAKEALDALFPFVCVGCGREGKSICAECEPGQPRLVPPRFCVVCAEPDVLVPSQLNYWRDRVGAV